MQPIKWPDSVWLWCGSTAINWSTLQKLMVRKNWNSLSICEKMLDYQMIWLYRRTLCSVTPAYRLNAVLIVEMCWFPHEVPYPARHCWSSSITKCYWCTAGLWLTISMAHKHTKINMQTMQCFIAPGTVWSHWCEILRVDITEYIFIIFFCFVLNINLITCWKCCQRVRKFQDNECSYQINLSNYMGF